MNAPLRSKTTVGQLLYPTRPSLDFERLVAELDSALAGAGAGERRTTLERDGLAVIDAGASRISVAMAENLDTAGAAAITVTVGFGPGDQGDARLARRQAVLARLIADRLAARSTPAETIWTESHEIATPEFLERSIEALAARREAEREHRPPPRHFVDLDDLPRLVAKVDATLDARRAGWVESVGVPAGLDLPEVDLSGLDARRTESAPSAALRLAAHLIDATLMVVLLPVGAAMMIYSLSRGANLTTSARAMALTGVGVSVVQALGGMGIVQDVLSRTI
ncbi:hypothetical protein Rumeso_01330 [Rubellimicrobium mesophilum DSM 19309]|uniref:Uncharacterized protein n=1 Tax=Rubellimicrobium mesophilum DSM 19309 TaxID=442562 RepID=A0A017HRT9_9RHOB|nr:hypothetical protein [Rubellimicrobium mesophilum]EYD77071.1 hypothetical protein Rumeso_01330 [Rubellimicrobium mesophilum DSM 19309]